MKLVVLAAMQRPLGGGRLRWRARGRIALSRNSGSNSGSGDMADLGAPVQQGGGRDGQRDHSSSATADDVVPTSPTWSFGASSRGRDRLDALSANASAMNA